MQHLEGSGTPVLYIGRTVLKGYRNMQNVGPFAFIARTARAEDLTVFKTLRRIRH